MTSRPTRPNRLVRRYPTGHGELVFGERCLVMGILNVTPDSFSDGGLHDRVDAAVDAAVAMVRDGVDVIDVGGESTRPGADPVSDSEQVRRVIPVIEAIRRRVADVPVSIDTRSSAVAAAALDAGADLVNDISAARDDGRMPELVAKTGVPIILMHMQGTPATMQASPHYDDVVREVAEFFDDRSRALAEAGVVPERMIVDPGIGFGKLLQHNLALLKSAAEFSSRWPVLVGASRKRFLGEILEEPDARQRLMGTAATVAHAAFSGVDMVRVHDVRQMRQVIDVCDSIRCA